MLYLDADNIALTDPADLFQSVDYLRTGALLWPDFWAPSPAPDLDAILRLARAEQPGEPAVEQPLRGAWNGTVETGQMVINKSTAWRGLCATLFLNLQARRSSQPAARVGFSVALSWSILPLAGELVLPTAEQLHGIR